MNSLGVISSWSLCGLVIGLIARLLVPGPHPVGILRPMRVGVVRAFLGGLIYWAVNHSPEEPYSFRDTAWHGCIFSIIGAVIVLVVYRWEQPRRTSW
jgi:uncharacterized membrane protein YeaQ/YmgE (transglycosylase-associated protein family)